MSHDELVDADGNCVRPEQVVLIDRAVGGPLPPIPKRSGPPENMQHPSGNPFLNRLLVILDKYRDLGEIMFPNGTMSIGKIPGKEKWFLHHIYGGLNPKQIEELSALTNTGFPVYLKKFYSVCNGMSLFGASQFQIIGYRCEARPDMPNYQPVPFFTAHPNSCRAIPNAPKDAIFIGGCFGGYNFYITTDSEIVYACKAPDATPIKQWANIEAMVLDAAERLSIWFDENAQPIDPIVNERPVLFESLDA